jgi:hypothetical protein
MLELIASQIIKGMQEKYKNNIIYKFNEYGLLNFYYYSKQTNKPILLRGCAKNNFKEGNKFYIGTEKMINLLISDYDYVSNEIM